MRAYKCDLCGEYCNDVFTLHGISKPPAHIHYDGIPGGSADCCVKCYDEIMTKIGEMLQKANQPQGDKGERYD